MLMGAIMAGLGGAVLSAGGALASGQTLATALGYYVAGGSAAMCGALALGARRRVRAARPAGGVMDRRARVS